MKVEYRVRGKVRAAMTGHESTMERAATKAMRELAKIVEKEGRAEIARGGLSKRFQTGFRARAKPRLGYSLKTSMRGYHRIGFINIFERGGAVAGKPLLWLPLSTAPQKINRRRITPAAFIEAVGPLHTISRPGRAPLLAGYATRRVEGPVSVAMLRSGARAAEARGVRRRGRRRLFSVPLFVGIKATKIADRLNVDRVYRQASDRLPRVYQEQMALEQTRRGQ